MKRTYTASELKEVNDHMMNYTVEVKAYGVCKTTFKAHVGLVGNHFEIIDRLAKEQFGNSTIVLGARITGKIWQTVNPF